MTKLELYARKAWYGFLDHSLWIAGIAVSAVSAGFDGAWLAYIMGPGWGWAGYMMNFVADITSELFMYQFGRMQKSSRRGSKQWKASWVILAFVFFSVCYSWLFGWQQIMRIIPAHPWYLSAIYASFVPMLLVGIGYTQAIVETRLDKIQWYEQKDLEAALAKQEQRLRAEFAKEMAYGRRAEEEPSRVVLERDGWHCFYCGVDMQNWPHDKIHVDHFWPVSKGGTDDPMNLVVACESCNLSKHARAPTDSEVAHFRARLVKQESIKAKEKVWILNHLGWITTQKAMAEMLSNVWKQSVHQRLLL
jgi:5-methylcytosine-specific restriction endonuclease McrA